jgi:DNA polymerase sigma
MPPPSPPPKPSKSEEKEKKAKKERKKERRAAQAKEQAAENKKRKHIVFDHDDYSDSGAQAPPTSDGEYLPWVSQVNWFDEEEGEPAGVVKLLVETGYFRRSVLMFSSSCFRAVRLNQEAKAAANWLAPTPIEHETRSMIVSRIIQCVKEAFPEAKEMRIQSFGSNENELYLPGG